MIKNKNQTDIANASIVNQNITPKCLFEENQKTVNSIYLKEAAYSNENAQNMGLQIPIPSSRNDRYKYNTTEIQVLNTIAYQNPMQGGDAVFMARIMLGIDVRDDMKTKSLIKKTLDKGRRIENYKLYPNPNNGEMQFSYTLATNETGVLKIYNAQVENVGTYPLVSGENILTVSAPQLMDGMYFYAVFVNNKKVFGDKFVISK